MRLDKFTLRGQEAIQAGIELAERNQNQQVETEHVLCAMLEQPEGIVRPLLGKLGANVQVVLNDCQAAISRFPRVQGGQQYFSPRLTQVFTAAQKQAEKMQDEYISTEHLLVAIAEEKEGESGKLLRQHGVNRDDLLKVIEQTRGGARVIDQNAEANYQALSKYARDLTDLARQGKLDPVIGRDDEIRRTVQVLSRRTKNNPVLLGEPGVGKTAIVEGLAQRIVDGNVPLFISNKRILSLDLSLIVAGTKYRGQFEERLKGIIKELKENPDIIIFIDEIHSLIGAGSAEGSLDAANILKPALSRGEISCIGATTIREYRRYIEKDRSLLRRFQAITVNPPTEDETLQILEGVKERYEAFHKVKYSDHAIRSAVYQSNRYITDRFFPDKAIDILDEAGAKVKLRRVADTQNLRRLESEIRSIVKEMKKAISDKDFEKAVFLREREIELKEEVERFKQERENIGDELMEVTKKDVEEIISSWTDIPVTSIEADEAAKLINM